LNALESKWNEKNSQFIIVYGKRRVGKTELLKQFMKNKRGIYFLADKRTLKEQLKELGRIIGEYFNEPFIQNHGFNDWLDVFQYLHRKATDRFMFVIDEYPYLVNVDKATSSVFQKGWAQYLKNTKIFFVLCGSSISMMESETLSYESPLYGRRTSQIFLKPLSFKQSQQFFRSMSFEEFLKIYTITDGMPAYLLQFDGKLSLEENIKKKIFLTTEFLHNEVEYMLKEELRETQNYFSILKAIAWGRTKFGEISNEAGLKKNVLMKYLGTLEKLQLIKKEVPVTEKNQHKSRKGLYRVSDNFLKFWFQYIFPYKSDLEIEQYDEVLRKLKESFQILEASAYENVCRELLWEIRDSIFSFERVGKWWEKNKEIDIVAISQKTSEILFGECKWSVKPVGINIYRDLKKKADSVQWEKGKRKERYILFSKSGFTKDMLNMAKQEGIFLVEKNKMILPLISKKLI
jgi:hypothetical protein